MPKGASHRPALPSDQPQSWHSDGPSRLWGKQALSVDTAPGVRVLAGRDYLLKFEVHWAMVFNEGASAEKEERKGPIPTRFGVIRFDDAKAARGTSRLGTGI